MAARHLTLPQPSSDGAMLEEPSQGPLLVRLTLIPKYKLTRVTLGCYPSGLGCKCSDDTTGTQDGQRTFQCQIHFLSQLPRKLAES